MRFSFAILLLSLFALPAAASLAPRPDRASFGKFALVEREPAPEELTVTDRTELLLDGLPVKIDDVPRDALITTVEYDRYGEVNKLYFRSRKPGDK